MPLIRLRPIVIIDNDPVITLLDRAQSVFEACLTSRRNINHCRLPPGQWATPLQERQIGSLPPHQNIGQPGGDLQHLGNGQVQSAYSTILPGTWGMRRRGVVEEH
ncbi:hypothetical protein TNCT_263801 [Trichonephila clavata]|uniref:Uncharacterized protein n=1 Tax=Trichonephila clavata TaxID=2740835 RepID=A0A8X6M2C6_TRICU|nr:hypothetical protein TNCT_263801 [Trichonephila clavata]